MTDNKPTGKQCLKCFVFKPLEDFYSLKNGLFGKDSRCKPCYNRIVNKWKKDNPELVKTYKENTKVSPEAAERRKNYHKNYMKTYNQQIVECECGALIKKLSLQLHLKSKTHKHKVCQARANLPCAKVMLECECGALIKKRSLWKHKQTNKHKAWEAVHEFVLS